MAAGVVTELQAQIQSAGTLFVNVDATALPDGPVTSLANAGTLGGVFAATADPTNAPVVTTIGGTKAMRFDGNDFLQHMSAVGGSPILAPEGLTGENPTRSIEVWALNQLPYDGEETMVSWGKRGGSPDGSNMSFNYGSDFRWGAVGHWGNRDIGWNNTGGGPAINRWHHLVYTYDGTTTRVYSDGALVNGEYLGEGAIFTHPDTTILLGAQTEPDGTTVTGGLRFTGAIGRVRVHDGVLTPAQIAANYNAEKAAFIDPTQPPPPEPVAPARLTKAPVHRYSFNEAAGDATDRQFMDSAQTAHGTVLGAGATFTGTRLVLPGGPSGEAAYGDLPNGLLSSNGVANSGSGGFSFEAFIKITGGRTWGRIFDIGSSGTAEGTEEVLGPGGGGEGRDYFAYTTQVDNNVGQRRLELRNEDPAGGGIVTIDNPTATFNQDTHVVVTWDEATGRIIAYENGVQVSTMTTDDKMSDINDVNVWLGRSNWTGDQNAQIEYDEVRIYDYALTAGQALGSAGAGPNQLNNADSAVVVISQPQSLTIPETSRATFTVRVQGSSPVSIQWLRNGTVIAGATSPTLVVDNVTAADNGAVFTARVSNTVNGAPVTVTSSPATLNVSSPTVTLKHRYSFNEGGVARDSIGGKDGALVGGASVSEGQLVLDGADGYADLPNGILSGLGQDGTIEMWITHQSAAIWTRIMDFGVSDQGEDASGNGVDYIFLTPRMGDGFPRFEANFPDTGVIQTLDPQPPAWLPANEETHVAISWSNSGNTSRLFFNGVPVSQGAASRPLSDLAGEDVNNWLGRSQFVADAYWSGKFNEFRLYSGAMTPSQAAASFAAGPNNLPVAAPKITASISGNNLVLSFPASTGFVLESATTLGSGANWTAVSGATATGATVPLEGRMRFFRLRRP